MISCEQLTDLSIREGETVNLALAITIGGFTAIAFLYSLELIVKSLGTFKRYSGLYFWSVQVATLGIILHTLAFILKFFENYDSQGFKIFNLVLITIGWWFMVTGQSLVLYSRLHLLVSDKKKLRLVLGMIIVDAIVFHFSTTTATFGSNLTTDPKWAKAFKIIEKTQMTVFSCQEFIISCLYLFETKKTLRPRKQFEQRRVEKVLRHLLWINILIILLDCALLACEYADLYVVEATMKPAIYAFKLRLEFPILNQLTSLFVRSGDNFWGHPASLPNLRDPEKRYSAYQAIVTPSPSRSPPGRPQTSISHGVKEEDEQGLTNDAILATTEIEVSSSARRWPSNPKKKLQNRLV